MPAEPDPPVAHPPVAHPPVAHPPFAHPPVGAGGAHHRAAAAIGEDVGSQRLRAWTRVVASARAGLARVRETRLYRANVRFGQAGGGVLTGGIAYAALFSIGAGLTVCWTVFVAVLGGNPELRDQVLAAIDDSLPGLVDTGAGGLLTPSDLQLSPSLTVAGVVAVAVLVGGALSAMTALRTGVRAMFDDPPAERNAVLDRVRDLVGLAGLAVAILVSALLTIATTSAADWLLGVVGWSGTLAAMLTRAAGVAVAFVVDLTVFTLVVRVLADQRPGGRALVQGAILTALGIGVVRLLGTSVVAGSAQRNPVLASVAGVATLLIWVNLISRIVLLGAAWVADPPLDDRVR